MRGQRVEGRTLESEYLFRMPAFVQSSFLGWNSESLTSDF